VIHRLDYPAATAARATAGRRRRARPTGCVAERIADLVDRYPMYGTSPLWRAFLDRCRLSTLQAYVHALGGRVHLVAELPGRDVEITVARPGT